MFAKPPLTTTIPLTNAERRKLWRRKFWQWRAKVWWALTPPHPSDPSATQYLGNPDELPAHLRRQAE